MDTTRQATEMMGVWRIFLLAGVGVYALVAGLIVYAIVAYRRRNANVLQGASFANNMPLEFAWTAIPLLMVAGLFVVTYSAERHVESVVSPAAEIVEVTAFRWSWRFVYPREHVTIEGTDAAPPELVLPAQSTTEVRLVSTDVVHSFWVPAFLFKRMAIPGRQNVFDFSPTRTGVYPARCAEFCGTEHAHMTFDVRIVPQAEFVRWLRARAAAS